MSSLRTHPLSRHLVLRLRSRRTLVLLLTTICISSVLGIAPAGAVGVPIEFAGVRTSSYSLAVQQVAGSASCNTQSTVLSIQFWSETSLDSGTSVNLHSQHTMLYTAV